MDEEKQVLKTLATEKKLRNAEIYGAGRRWTTQDECDWLSRIGETSTASRPRPKFDGVPAPVMTKKQMLQSYVRNAGNRAE
jgi:hypothetical protein